jgi:hypothetical protein
MKSCPFGGPDYEGEMVATTCDSCGDNCTYEEDAYGQNFLVLCPKCKGESGLLDPTDAPTNTTQKANLELARLERDAINKRLES